MVDPLEVDRPAVNRLSEAEVEAEAVEMKIQGMVEEAAEVVVDSLVAREEAVEAEPSGEETEESKERGASDDAEEMRPAHLQTGGTEFPSAGAPLRGTTRPYALDVSIRAEINPKDPEGRTVGYGFSIPSLEV